MDQEEITKKVNESKNQLDQLRKELTLINDQKEQWFTKKEELNAKIALLITDIKKNKALRDECSSIVKEHKKKRDELNVQLPAKLDTFKQLTKDKTILLEKHNIKGDPSFLKKEIEKLEQTIETNVMSFDKEKQLMKRINELRKQYKGVEQVSILFEQVNLLGREIDELRTKANDEHRQMQIKAKESQDKHVIILTLSKEIDELRKKEQDAFAKFLEFKNKFVDVNEQMKKELTELNQRYNLLGEKKAEQQVQKQRKFERQLEQLEDKVEEKIKKRKKLTTEDLLVFQQQAELEEQNEKNK